TFGSLPKISSTSSSSASGAPTNSIPSHISTLQVPQLADRHEKGTSVSGRSSVTSISRVPVGTATSTPAGSNLTGTIPEHRTGGYKFGCTLGQSRDRARP